MNHAITSPLVPTPAGPYSPGIVSGGFLFLAGQGPFNAQGKIVGKTFADQLKQTFQNLQNVALAAGTSLEHTVRIGVYLNSMDNWAELNALSREFFIEPYPARTTIQADLKGFEIEVDAVIALPDEA